MIELKALSIADINKLDRLFMKAATAALETVKSNVNSAKNNKQVDYQYLQLHDDEIAQYIRLFIESPLNRLAFKQQDNPWLELDTKQNDLKDSLLILGNNLIESIDMLSILETPRCIAERLALPIMVYTLFSNNEFNSAAVNKRHQRKQNRKATDIILPPEETDIKVWDNKMISQYQQRDKQRKKAKIPQWKYKNPFAVKRLTGTGRTETKGPYMDLCEKANSIVRNVSFPYHDIIFTNQNGHGIELAEWELAKALANNPHKLYQYQERGVLGLFLRSILEKAPEHHYQKQLLPYNSTVRNFLRISPEDNTDLQNNSEMEIINKQIDTLLRMYIANSIDGILMDCAGEYTFTESGYEYYNNHANNLLTTYWYTCYADSNFERKDILSNLPQADELSDDFYTLYHFLIHNIQVSSGDVNAVLNYYLNEARLHSMQNIQKSCMEYLKSFISFFENGEPLICQPFINEHYISELKERKDLTQSVKRFFDDKKFVLVAALGGTEGVKRMIATEIWDMYFNYEKGFTTNEPAVCRFYSMDESECFNCEYRDQFSGMDGSFICPHNFFKPALERYLSSSELVSHREALRKKLRRSTKTNIQL